MGFLRCFCCYGMAENNNNKDNDFYVSLVYKKKTMFLLGPICNYGLFFYVTYLSHNCSRSSLTSALI